MATIGEITQMCRDGHIQDAYNLAIAEKEQDSDQLRAERKIGWALYYFIKDDVCRTDYQSLITHLDELNSLKNLSIPADNMIFENVLFKIAMFVKNNVPPTNIESPAKLSTLFSKLRNYTFEPSKGYSFLLSSFIKCDSWQEMDDFIDWWNLDKLTLDDYTPFRTENGRTIMSLAERTFIAKSKALLCQNDLGRIEVFLPKLDHLMELHPEMTYPGYFYGKLLLSLGSNAEEALKAILPFARKKATDFWVWQLLSDVFVNDREKQLACLLRAVHCRTQENFLGKVRIKLAMLYESINDFNRARHHIDVATRTYAINGWPLPYDLDVLIHKSWINTSTPDKSDSIDYQTISDGILCVGTEETVAVVTYFDPKSCKATLIYGKEKRMVQKLGIKVGAGAVLKINYVTEADGNLRILSTSQTPFPKDLNFAKIIQGTIKKREEWDFAFLHYGNDKAFVTSNTISKYNVVDGEIIKALVVYDYNRKKEKWNWVCISIKR